MQGRLDCGPTGATSKFAATLSLKPASLLLGTFDHASAPRVVRFNNAHKGANANGFRPQAFSLQAMVECRGAILDPAPFSDCFRWLSLLGHSGLAFRKPQQTAKNGRRHARELIARFDRALFLRPLMIGAVSRANFRRASTWRPTSLRFLSAVFRHLP